MESTVKEIRGLYFSPTHTTQRSVDCGQMPALAHGGLGSFIT